MLFFLLRRRYRSGIAQGARPNSILIALWLFAGLAILRLGFIIATFATFHHAAVATAHQQSRAIHEHVSIGTAIPVLIFGLVFSAAASIAQLIGTRALQRGAAWSRILLPVVTGMSIGVNGHVILGTAACAAAVVASILLFIPPSNTYFRTAA
jgi:hypothetical protein